jgi:dTDP-4-dehydrorhamnose reductase
MPTALVVRTSAFFGPWDEYNFLYLALLALQRGEQFRAAQDVRVSPTYVPDLVNAGLDLLVDGAAGVWHIANRGETDWAEFARKGAALAGVDPAGVVACSAEELGWEAPRPRYSVLGSERGLLLPDLEHALARFVIGMPA